MKLGLFPLLFFISFWQVPSVSELRNVYPSLAADAILTEKIVASLSEVKKTDGVKKWAYQGAVRTIMAKHVRNKKKKKEFFTQGVTQLEEAIAMAPNDIELRCLRLSVQENSPRFLGYHRHMAEDKAFLLAHFSETSSQGVVSFIQQYVAQSDAFSASEKAQFR